MQKRGESPKKIGTHIPRDQITCVNTGLHEEMAYDVRRVLGSGGNILRQDWFGPLEQDGCFRHHDRVFFRCAAARSGVQVTLEKV